MSMKVMAGIALTACLGILLFTYELATNEELQEALRSMGERVGEKFNEINWS